MTSPMRLPRGRRTPTAVLLALLILVAAVAVGYLAVVKVFDLQNALVEPADVAAWLRETTFDSSIVLIGGIVVALIGLLVLLKAVLPSKQRLIELTAPDDHTAAAVDRRSLRRTVQSSAVAIDGISAARAGIGRSAVSLDVTSSLRHTDGLQDAATAAVRKRLDTLALRHPRTVKTRLTRKES